VFEWYGGERAGKGDEARQLKLCERLTTFGLARGAVEEAHQLGEVCESGGGVGEAVSGELEVESFALGRVEGRDEAAEDAAARATGRGDEVPELLSRADPRLLGRALQLVHDGSELKPAGLGRGRLGALAQAHARGRHDEL